MGIASITSQISLGDEKPLKVAEGTSVKLARTPMESPAFAVIAMITPPAVEQLSA
jgi:hypothetical protein